MDDIDIPKALAECSCGMELNLMDTTFFFSREKPDPHPSTGIALARTSFRHHGSQRSQPHDLFFGSPPTGWSNSERNWKYERRASLRASVWADNRTFDVVRRRDRNGSEG